MQQFVHLSSNHQDSYWECNCCCLPCLRRQPVKLTATSSSGNILMTQHIPEGVSKNRSPEEWFNQLWDTSVPWRAQVWRPGPTWDSVARLRPYRPWGELLCGRAQRSTQLLRKVTVVPCCLNKSFQSGRKCLLFFIMSPFDNHWS